MCIAAGLKPKGADVWICQSLTVGSNKQSYLDAEDFSTGVDVCDVDEHTRSDLVAVKCSFVVFESVLLISV